MDECAPHEDRDEGGVLVRDGMSRNTAVTAAVAVTDGEKQQDRVESQLALAAIGLGTLERVTSSMRGKEMQVCRFSLCLPSY